MAEWAARIVVSYLACPAEGVDLTDAVHVRRLVRQFILPGIRTLLSQSTDEGRGTSRRPAPTFVTTRSTSMSKGEAAS